MNTTRDTTPQHHYVAPRTSRKPEREPGFVSELVRFALVALLIVIPIRVFIAQPFVVSGASMFPTFENGEYLIIDEISYRFAEPERGDVVVFRFPEDPSKFFIKRIIGLPGETVSARRGTVFVTNTENPEGLALNEPYISAPVSGTFSSTLEADEYFVLGDNRPASSDSRVWGTLPRDNIVGRALVRLLPVARADVLPGHIETSYENTITP